MDRPNPDALLAKVKAEDTQRGKLKIFFGMSPGVGKTYAMLQEAKQRQTEGFRVLIGVVCTHGRTETEALVQGLEQIPQKQLNTAALLYRKWTLMKSSIAILSMFSPMNLPTAMLREAGTLNVIRMSWSCCLQASMYSQQLNVQHIESRREDIHAVTRIIVGETVPDTILDEAAEITLVDISPQALRQRLAEGKVYVSDQAQAAAVNFFKTENLTVLREMVLRLTAAHVNRNLRSLMSAKGIGGPFKSGERILVAVGATPFSESLIRMTRRWAGMLDASWIALHVEGSQTLPDEHKERVLKNLTLASQLGAEIIHQVGDDIAQVIMDVADKEHVTQIIVGKTLQSQWQRWLGVPTLSDKLVNVSGEIDVHMVRISSADKNFPNKPKYPMSSIKRNEYLLSILMCVAATAINLAIEHVTGYRTVGLLYLLTVVLSGVFLGRTAAFILAALNAVTWDFLFIPPKWTFMITSKYDMAMLGMFFVTGLMMGQVTSKLRRQKEIEQKQRLRSEALYELTRALAVSTDLNQAMRVASQQINLLYQCSSSVVMIDENEQPLYERAIGDVIDMSDNQKALVHWVVNNKKPAGRFSDTLPQQPLMFLPLISSGQVRAVLVIKLADDKPLDLARRTLLESFTSLMTVMLEKDELLKISREAKMREETQNLQSALLDNLSHELKTPLTIISGYLDALVLYHAWPKDAMDLLEESRQACLRLTSSVDAVLDLTILDTGNLRPNFSWCEVKDVITQALKQAIVDGDKDRVHVDCPQGSLYVNVDIYMITQALKNIIHNALVHGPENGHIDLHVRIMDQMIRISVIDQGEGIPKETLAKIFDKFYRGAKTKKGGLGLGLSIARRFVQLNEGNVEAENLLPKGFMVTITLPMAEKE